MDSSRNNAMKSSVRFAGWSEVGNDWTTRKSIPLSLGLEKGNLCWGGVPHLLSPPCLLSRRSDYPIYATHTLSRRGRVSNLGPCDWAIPTITLTNNAILVTQLCISLISSIINHTSRLFKNCFNLIIRICSFGLCWCPILFWKVDFLHNGEKSVFKARILRLIFVEWVIVLATWMSIFLYIHWNPVWLSSKFIILYLGILGLENLL